MNRVISILSLIVLFQSVFSSNELTRLRLSNGHITSHPLQASRNLDTYFIDFSYMNDTSVIEADFGTPFYTKNNGTNQNNTLMAVTISSNETVFFGNFSEGNDYFECDPSYCTQDNSTSFQYNSTWLTGNVTPITLTTPISVAFGAWQLATPALYMANAPSELEYPGGVYGSIGLGSGAGAQQNFYGQNPLFSLLYNFSSSSGDLIFGYNSTYANTSKPSMTVTSDPDWQMQLASISVGNQTVYTVNSTNPITMLFDLATMDIDLPSDIVTNITNGMSGLGMNCYGVGCTASNLTGLPSIIFTLADNTQLTLGPEVYMMSTGDSSDSTDTSDSADPSAVTSDINYVTIPFEILDDTGYFANHIVFGTQILAHFYTVFQQVNEGHTITLYSVPDGVTIEDQISPPITPDDSSPAPDVSTASNPKTHALYIIISACVALVIVLIGTIILGVKRGWFKKKKAPESEESAITVELNESQVSGHSNEGLNL